MAKLLLLLLVLAVLPQTLPAQDPSANTGATVLVSEHTDFLNRLIAKMYEQRNNYPHNDANTYLLGTEQEIENAYLAFKQKIQNSIVDEDDHTLTQWLEWTNRLTVFCTKMPSHMKKKLNYPDGFITLTELLINMSDRKDSLLAAAVYYNKIEAVVPLFKILRDVYRHDLLSLHTLLLTASSRPDRIKFMRALVPPAARLMRELVRDPSYIASLDIEDRKDFRAIESIIRSYGPYIAIHVLDEPPPARCKNLKIRIKNSLAKLF